MTVSNLSVTIGIPTYNRANMLGKILQSLQALVRPADLQYDICVVDNRSTDNTRQVIEQYRNSFNCPFFYFMENRQGVSFARNRILQESQSTLIGYLDDDVIVHPHWLSALRKAYQRWPEAAAVGGKADLIFESDPPKWIGPRERKRLSEFQLGNQPRLLLKEEFLWGLNMSVRRSLAISVGMFRQDLDRVGNNLRGGGDIELIERIQKAGGRVYYDPAMKVGHYVPSERLKKLWFLRRSYWSGWTRQRIRRIHKDRTIEQEKLDLIKTLPLLFRSISAIIFYGLKSGFSSAAVYEHAHRAASLFGSVYEWLEFKVQKPDIKMVCRE